MFLFGPVVFLIGLALAAYTLLDLARHWSAFWDDDVRPDERQRAYRVAFFILVPIGVLLHELGHAAAVWQLGGRVVEFNWSFLSGYVVPDRAFAPLGEWWLYFSGNLVSILLVPLALLVLLLPVGPMVKFVAFAFAQLEWYVALIGYPLLSLGGVEGDWVGIYRIPPLPLRVAIGVAHIGLLILGFWVSRRPRVRRWELLLSRAARERVARAERAIQERPGDPRPKLELGAFYLENGEAGLAKAAVRQALAIDPHHPDALVAAGTLAGREEKFAQAAVYYAQALARLPEGPPQAMVAARLGQIYLRMDKPTDAVEAFSRAINNGVTNAEAFYWRGRAYLRLGNNRLARGDFQQAAALDPGGAVGQQSLRELRDIDIREPS